MIAFPNNSEPDPTIILCRQCGGFSRESVGKCSTRDRCERCQKLWPPAELNVCLRMKPEPVSFLFIGGSKHKQKLPINLPAERQHPDRYFRCVVPKPIRFSVVETQTSDMREELECYRPVFISCHTVEFCFFVLEQYSDEAAIQQLMKAAEL